MTLLILGLAIFIGLHSLPMFQATRAAIVARLGAMPYRLLYSLLSAAGLSFIIYGKSIAPAVPLWSPAPWGSKIAMLIMPVAMASLAAAYIPNNFKRVVAHPMLLGTGLWAGAHLISNGDLSSALLFGSFLVWSIVDSVAATRRNPATSGERKPIYLDLLVLVTGFFAFLIIRQNHAALFGVPVWISQ